MTNKVSVATNAAGAKKRYNRGGKKRKEVTKMPHQKKGHHVTISSIIEITFEKSALVAAENQGDQLQVGSGVAEYSGKPTEFIHRSSGHRNSAWKDLHQGGN